MLVVRASNKILWQGYGRKRPNGRLTIDTHRMKIFPAVQRKWTLGTMRKVNVTVVFKFTE